MTTAVRIASNAMLRLGADPINSFDEADETGSNIERARLASNLWPTIRRKVLRAHPWNCAIRRALLSPDATAPAFGFANRFLRPSDWLRTVAIGLDEADRPAYRTEGSYFLSDEAQFPLVYVFDNDNPATYDAMLFEVMEIAMAAAMAYPVTKSTSNQESAEQIYRDTIALARGVDGQDDPPETLGDFPLYRSRFGARLVPGIR